MNMGFGASLGVGCGHCHVPGKWASEDKKDKQIARDMWNMTQTINHELLAKIPNLDEDNRSINCTTCHRGDTTPALTLPAHSTARRSCSTGTLGSGRMACGRRSRTPIRWRKRFTSLWMASVRSRARYARPA